MVEVDTDMSTGAHSPAGRLALLEGKAPKSQRLSLEVRTYGDLELQGGAGLPHLAEIQARVRSPAAERLLVKALSGSYVAGARGLPLPDLEGTVRAVSGYQRGVEGSSANADLYDFLGERVELLGKRLYELGAEKP